jgi:pilus assembly protein Flp/PilA
LLSSIKNALGACAVAAQTKALSLLSHTEREEGQGMVEYALILVLIAIVVIIVLTVVGHKVSDVFNTIQNGLN